MNSQDKKALYDALNRVMETGQHEYVVLENGDTLIVSKRRTKVMVTNVTKRDKL